MPTTKQRINISVSDELKRSLVKLARRDRMPTATKAAHLMTAALEIEEDMVWNEIAEKRDRKGARFTSHKKAW